MNFINLESSFKYSSTQINWLSIFSILLSPFCGGVDCEGKIKEQSTREETGDVEQGTALMGARTLCIPLEQPKEKLPDKCINPECNQKTNFFALFGRSY